MSDYRTEGGCSLENPQEIIGLHEESTLYGAHRSALRASRKENQFSKLEEQVRRFAAAINSAAVVVVALMLLLMRFLAPGNPAHGRRNPKTYGKTVES